jgi:hypothetical protein
MQGAVEKRRTTLANKKAEKATANPADPNATGQTTESGSAGTSDPATPVSMPGQGLLALPQGPILLQAPAHPQGILQQPPFVYAMPPGAPPGSMEYRY